MEKLKALAPMFELELHGESTICEDYNDGVWNEIRQQIATMSRHSSVVIEQERWFDESGQPHEFFHFSSVPDRSHQVVKIIEQCRGELVFLMNEVNNRVAHHEQTHENIRITMDTALDNMARIASGLHECNVRDRQLYEGYQGITSSWNCHMQGFRDIVVPTLVENDELIRGLDQRIRTDIPNMAKDLETHGKCIDTHAKQINGLYTNFKAFTGKSLTGSPSATPIEPPLVRMERDIKTITQKLESASGHGAKVNEVATRISSLETRIGSTHQLVERIGLLEVGLQGLSSTWDRVSRHEVGWQAFEGVHRHVQALLPLTPHVSNLVRVEDTVSSLSTQVSLLDEEVECLKRENESLRQTIPKQSPLTMETVTLMIQQVEDRVTRKYDAQIASMEFECREFKRTVNENYGGLLHRFSLLESSMGEAKRERASLSSKVEHISQRMDLCFDDLTSISHEVANGHAMRSQLQEVSSSLAHVERAVASLLPLLPKSQSLQNDLARVHSVMAKSHDCDASCSCRALISNLQDNIDEIKSQGIAFSSSLGDLQFQTSKFNTAIDRLWDSIGSRSTHSSHCSELCSCPVQLTLHGEALKRIDGMLDELRDCFDAMSDELCTRGRDASFGSTLSSMKAQLDNLLLSSQSIDTLQVKVAALEDAYEKWTTCCADEEEDESDEEPSDQYGVRFAS